MWQSALSTVAPFTLPVLYAARKVSGDILSGHASFVVLNQDGWILTAAHVLKQAVAWEDAASATTAADRRREEIRQDSSLDKRARQLALQALPRTTSDSIHQAVTMWGLPGSRVTEMAILDELDLAAARLEPFNLPSVTMFPRFKEPTSCRPGTSLCRLGFPLQKIPVVWDDQRSAFSVPQTIPPCFFPLDGILARFEDLTFPAGEPTYRFPLRRIEISTPSLPGHSGGPIFDVRGVVWGITTHTTFYDLGVKTKVPQFWGVGAGAHSVAIIGMLQDRDIPVEVVD